MIRQWTAYATGDRKVRPRYTREQLGRARQRLGGGGTVGNYRPGPGAYGRRYLRRLEAWRGGTVTR